MTMNDGTCIARIELQDALLDEEGSIAVAPYRCIMFVRPPAAWTTANGLTDDGAEQVLCAIYGPTWREGNVDGSFFRVLEMTTVLLSDAEVSAREWCAVDEDDERFRYWFWRAEDETLRSVTAEEL
jgi:hypothetical protein